MYSIDAVNGALWTIKIEVAFYMILPLVIFIIERIKGRKGKNLFLSFCYVFSVIWNLFFVYFGTKRNSAFITDLAHQFPGFITCFAAGILCVYNWNFLQKHLNKIIFPALLVFVLHYFTHTEILMPLALTICVMWFGLKLPCLDFIGKKTDFSFGMYLVHFPIIQFCVYLEYFNCLPFFAVLLVFASSFTIAYLINLVFSIQKKLLIKGDK